MRLMTLWVAIVLPLGGMFTAVAVAQTGTVAQNQVLEEVTVTARKRSESLQDVPLAVTAINEETIREMRIDNIEGVGTMTPNLVVQTSAGGSPSAVACMRGMCRTNVIITEDPMVGTYVDGVYLGKAVGSLLDVLELERVEVLRGPQGTLFGMNTLGGAINMVTRKPTGEFGGDITLTGGNEGIKQVRASVDFPVTSSLAARVGYLNKQRDPVVHNPIGPDYGDEDMQAGSLALRWDASDSFTISYNFDLTDMNQLPDATTLTFANTPVYTVPGDPTSCISGCTLIGWDVLGVDLSENVTKDFTDTYYSDGLEQHQNMDIYGHSLIAEWDLGNNKSLKSITSYREVDVDFALGYGVQIFYATRTDHTDSFSQEFQFQGLGMNDRLSYTAGLFYFWEKGKEVNSQNIPGFFAISGYDARVKSESYAVFGEATYDLTDQWDITLGLRYTKENKRANNIAYSPLLPGGFIFMDTYNNTYNGSTTLPDGSDVSYETHIDNDNLSPRVSVSYAPTDTIMFYGTYAQGYKSGGFNAFATSPVSWEPYDHVVLNSFELGVKATLWDGRAQLNVTAFHSEAQDMQVQVNSLNPIGTFETQLVNAGQADINGVEVEAKIRPTDSLDINLGFGYQDAGFNEYLAPDGMGGTVDVSDARVLEFTPDYTYNLGVRYMIAATDYGTWSTRVDVHGMGNLDFQAEPVNEVDQGAYSLVDARLALDEVRVGSGTMAFSLWGMNLTDKSYRTGGFTFTEDMGFNSYGMPRTYGVDVEYSF